MKRVHLFEFHDQSWFPASLRNLLTDFMSFFAVRFRPYDTVGPFLMPKLACTGSTQVVDLCSGAGGSARCLLDNCSESGALQFRVVLSDKYPNVDAYRLLQHRYSERISYVEQPVDAGDVPSSMRGFRTMFTAFHHFRPDTARAVLSDAVRKGQPIGIFEYTERNLFVWGLPLLFTPLFIWLCTPKIRPFLWKRLFWTYLLPVVPLIGAWDGLISCLRTYSPAELLDLTASIDGQSYDWQAGRLSSFGACRITYLVGMPRFSSHEPLATSHE